MNRLNLVIEETQSESTIVYWLHELDLELRLSYYGAVSLRSVVTGSRQPRSVSYHTVLTCVIQLCLQTLPAVLTNIGNSDLLRIIPPTGLSKFK